MFLPNWPADVIRRLSCWGRDVCLASWLGFHVVLLDYVATLLEKSPSTDLSSVRPLVLLPRSFISSGLALRLIIARRAFSVKCSVNSRPLPCTGQLTALGYAPFITARPLLPYLLREAERCERIKTLALCRGQQDLGRVRGTQRVSRIWGPSGWASSCIWSLSFALFSVCLLSVSVCLGLSLCLSLSLPLSSCTVPADQLSISILSRLKIWLSQIAYPPYDTSPLHLIGVIFWILT